MSDDLDRLAAEPLDETDRILMRQVKDAWTARDPVPEGMTDRIRFAMTVASLEADLARIVTEVPAGAGVRTAYERTTSVTFESGSVSAMLDIEEVGAGRVDVTGWVSIHPVEVVLHERHRTRTVRSDGTGRFVFDDVERGLVHFVIHVLDRPGQRPIITPTIEL
ncbi:MAG TPA: hypothetical protein GXZ60_05315 [Intrasporangiaceae bacterium]|nr:hypothetical protein [Intrasporangiaceae bacterium]